ncbi:transposase family protein [candidate division WOR-3 bacterium]|nr:transposase family protein [candidate division WOR-3 bacterium]
MREKQAVTRELARRCVRAGRRAKAAIVDQVVSLAGCNRSYATWLLRTCARRVTLPQARGPTLVCEAADGGRRPVCARPRPDSLPLRQIPIVTHVERRADRPGHIQVDLVGHDGGSAAGEHCQTLDVTDLYCGWTETAAVRNKAHCWTLAALRAIRGRLPFPLLGIHSGNGPEFINNALYEYCRADGLEFARSRPYQKNDNRCVEQKNYSVVRRAVGYLRYETGQQLGLLNRLYAELRPYTNFFQPVVKLLVKTRVGSRVHKRYEPARTPYQLLLGWEGLEPEARGRLAEEYRGLNPAELKRRCERLQRQLLKEAAGQAAPAGHTCILAGGSVHAGQGRCFE